MRLGIKGNWQLKEPDHGTQARATHSDDPRYPTRREVLAGAASFALVNLAGCNFAFAESEEGKIIVAPIFEHGEGRGVTGCVVITPPVFLSEEEGMQILREELARHGVRLKAGGTLEGVRVPARIEKYESVDKGGGKQEIKTTVVEVPDKAKPLKLSGIDSDKNIAVEFVSTKDYDDLGGLGARGSVQHYDFKEVAEYVAARSRNKARTAFSSASSTTRRPRRPTAKPPKEDSMARLRYDSATTNSMTDARPTKEDSKELLRQQAQDFVAWLKEQKAIR